MWCSFPSMKQETPIDYKIIPSSTNCLILNADNLIKTVIIIIVLRANTYVTHD